MNRRKDKVSALKYAKQHNRKVLWKDDKGNWHAATNRDNTPRWAVEVEDIEDERPK